MKTIKEFVERGDRYLGGMKYAYAYSLAVSKKAVQQKIYYAYLLFYAVIRLLKRDLICSKNIYQAVYADVTKQGLKLANWSYLGDDERDVWVQLSGWIRANRTANAHQYHLHRYLLLTSKGIQKHHHLKKFEDLSRLEKDLIDIHIKHVLKDWNDVPLSDLKPLLGLEDLNDDELAGASTFAEEPFMNALARFVNEPNLLSEKDKQDLQDAVKNYYIAAITMNEQLPKRKAS